MASTSRAAGPVGTNNRSSRVQSGAAARLCPRHLHRAGYRQAGRATHNIRTQAVQQTVLEAAKAARERRSATQSQNNARQRPAQQRDYLPHADDKAILTGAPRELVDAADVSNCFDYPRNLDERYDVRSQLGSGGQGTVYRAIEKETGVHYACKSIPKMLPKFSGTTPHHLLKIRSEVDTMMQMGASLDVVFLKEVFEDDEHVHMIIELCEGGHVAHELDVPDLSEDEIAGIMRSVLRFIAQCAANGVVYRDCKPGNFLFTETSPSNRRVKATDLGLATRHWPEDIPLTSTTGTTIYMAPEVIHKAYGAAADVYSAGVMCFKLLTGRYPYWSSMRFTKKPTNKEIFSKITKEDIDFSFKRENISEGAKEFLQYLLEKDPKQRPAAADALTHPWLREEVQSSVDGSMPALEGTLIQRLQRFALMGRFKKVVLTMVAEELMADEDTWREILQDCSELDDIYHDIAGSKDGDVEMADVKAFLGREGYDISEPEITKLLSHMDVNRDGTMGYHEFMTCLMDWDKLATRHKRVWDTALRSVFRQIDLEDQGQVSVEDVAARLRTIQDLQPHEGMGMLRHVDRDRDGVVSWKDFYETVMLVGAGGCRGAIYSPLHLFDRRVIVD